MRVNSGTWRAEEGQFVGNECSWTSPSGRLHGCKQHHVNEMVLRIARELDGAPLLTLDSHFVRPETKMVQDILLQNGNKNGWRASSAYYQMSTDQAWEDWVKNHRSLPGYESVFQEAVENNTRFAGLIEPFTFDKRFHLPVIDIPPNIGSAASDEDDALMRVTLSRIKLHGRMPKDPVLFEQYLLRLQKELDVIANNGVVNFLPYFLVIDMEVTAYMESVHKLMGPGRGSAAGCLLSYLLKITHIDPIVWDLSFERFLSMGRISRGKFPDIDLDFGDPKQVVHQLNGRFGDKFARICTTGTAKLKGAIKDVSRILLGTQDDKELARNINDLCETIDNVPQGMDTKKWLYGYEDSEGRHVGHIDQNRLLAKFFEDHPQVHAMVDEVLGVPRSVGRHASAYCISDVPVGELVPMCIVNEEQCTQFTMGPVESLGLIKMDFLGLNTLNDIEGAIKKIRERHGIIIDIYQMKNGMPDVIHEGDVIGVDITCRKSFKEFCAGNTATVFQFKTKVATPLCLDIQPKNLMDLASITANGRPGTMYALMEDGKTTLIEEWVGRRKGDRPVTYLHPDLKPILEPTDGIFTFQEQIMAAFVKCCGYSEEESDAIRETIGKKKRDQMEKILPDIRQRLDSRGWSAEQINSFISLCVAASNYSFNKSHSLAYAYLGFVCMWLKTNFKIEWWNSVLQNSNFDDLKDAAKHVHDIVDPPDINTSEPEFYIINDKKDHLVFPINRVKNVKAAGEFILQARNPDGVLVPFRSLADFYDRVNRRKVNKRVVASLIWSGAFDAVCGVGHILDRNRVYREYLALKSDKDASKFVDLDFPKAIRAQMELLAIGSSDIATYIKEKVGCRILGPAEVMKVGKGLKVHMGGLCSRVSKVKTKKGKNPGSDMAFVDIEDNGATIPVTFFPDIYDICKDVLVEGAILYINGKVDEYKGKKQVLASEVCLIRDEIESLDLEETYEQQ